jgi:UDPglucose 6-dehydrogenase
MLSRDLESSVNITVVGVGHVGLVSAACFAHWGHDVVGMDDDADKIRRLASGDLPFFEPGLAELLEEVTGEGRLSFTTDIEDAVGSAAVVFVCVGTPPSPNGGLNLSFVEAVGRNVARYARRSLVLVEKSTVPVNTGARLAQVIDRERGAFDPSVTIEVASNPEFLREGVAVEDTLHPDRIVYGTNSERARDALRRVYEAVVREDDCPVIETDVPTAELIKHASNAFLATKVSFINAIARISERVGADVDVVADGMGYDKRIGRHFLQAGLGYGGSCFPKDVEAFVHLSREVGYDFALLEEVGRINVGQRAVVLEKLRSELWHLDGKTVTLLGAAFKPGTDDLREAPAIHLGRELLAAGAIVRIYDPVALPNVKQELPEADLFDDPADALRGAHAAVVVTDWEQIKRIPVKVFREELTYPIVIDGRNALSGEDLSAAGVRYVGIGKNVPKS